MVRLLPCASLLTAALPVATLGAQGFEGTLRMRSITFDVTPVLEQQGNDPARLMAVPWERVLAAARSAGAQIEVDSAVYQIKGSRVRVSLGATEAGYVVTDLQTGSVLMIDPSDRTYVEWTREDVKKMMNAFQNMAPELPDPGLPDLEPLGTTRDIRGRRCAEYRMTDEQSLTIACLTQDLADLSTLFQRWGEMALDPDDAAQRTQLAALTRHGFPLLLREVTSEGDDQTRSAYYEVNEFFAIERGTLPDGLFITPPGFRKTTF